MSDIEPRDIDTQFTGPETIDATEKGKKKITLEDILDFNRQIPEEYKSLIQTPESARTGHQFETFSDQWRKQMDFDSHRKGETVTGFLKKYLEGEVLIDLGAGEGEYIEGMCRALGVSYYVRVEVASTFEDGQDLPEMGMKYREDEINGLQVINVQSDMLNFVARMKDNSGNFVLNGIDEYMTPGSDYDKPLTKELTRTTQTNGLVFGTSSSVSYWLDKMQKETKLKSVKIEDRMGEIKRKQAGTYDKEHDDYLKTILQDSFYFIKTEMEPGQTI